MGNRKSKQNLVNKDIIVTANQINSRTNSFADKWWSNMLAVVKLRQKGTTIVSKLPGGVFRHMLEYQIPKPPLYRYSKPYRPISQAQDRKFPATDKLDYDNYMVGIEDSKRGVEYRMILKDKSTCNTQASG